MKMTALSKLLSVVLVSSVVGSLGCGGGGGGAAGEAKSADSAGGVNNPAPDFSLESVNGLGKAGISAWKGKVIVVDFWATWCEPCKKSFPKLQELSTKYKASGLEIVGVSEDDDSTGIKEFGATYGAKFPLVWDKDKSVAGKWKPASMPGSFIVDRKGVVRFVHSGFHPGDEVELDKEIKSLL